MKNLSVFCGFIFGNKEFHAQKPGSVLVYCLVHSQGKSKDRSMGERNGIKSKYNIVNLCSVVQKEQTRITETTANLIVLCAKVDIICSTFVKRERKLGQRKKS